MYIAYVGYPFNMVMENFTSDINFNDKNDM